MYIASVVNNGMDEVSDAVMSSLMDMDSAHEMHIAAIPVIWMVLSNRIFNIGAMINNRMPIHPVIAFRIHMLFQKIDWVSMSFIVAHPHPPGIITTENEMIGRSVIIDWNALTGSLVSLIFPLSMKIARNIKQYANVDNKLLVKFMYV